MGEYVYYDIPRDDLSSKLGGGLAKGSITVIKGVDGAGKSVFAQRFCFGFLEHDLKVSFISSELSTRDFIKQMNSLEYNILSHLLKRKLLFIPVFPITVQFKKKEDLLKRLVASSHLFKSDVIIIDSLNALVESKKITESDILSFTTFLKRIIGIGKTIIINVDPSTISKKVTENLEEIASNLVALETRVFQTDVKNVAVIKRWSRAEQEISKVIAYRVEPRIGIIVDISAVSG